MISIVIISRNGHHASVSLPGHHVVETSVQQLAIKSSARSVLASLEIGAIILEDMRFDELSSEIQAALKGREGLSCPIVTRWTAPRTGNAI